MRLHDRDIKRIALAPFDRRHWRALAGMVRTYDQPAVALRRYLANSGTYPWSPTLHTPTGDVRPRLANYHDLLTVNEIFCRRDYGDGAVRTVVDIGANIGLAGLFFLTRSPHTRVWCIEPDPANLVRLRETLAEFLDRVVIIEKAVTPEQAGTVRFATAGRYGQISDAGSIEVTSIDIAALVRQIEAEVGTIDLVKIDTEGSEAELVAAIPPECHIGRVVYEDNAGRTRWA